MFFWVFLNGSSLSRCFIWACYQMNMWSKSNGLGKLPTWRARLMIFWLIQWDTMTLSLLSFLIRLSTKANYTTVYSALLYKREKDWKKTPRLTEPFITLLSPNTLYVNSFLFFFLGLASIAGWFVSRLPAERKRQSVIYYFSVLWNRCNVLNQIHHKSQGQTIWLHTCACTHTMLWSFSTVCCVCSHDRQFLAMKYYF